MSVTCGDVCISEVGSTTGLRRLGEFTNVSFGVVQLANLIWTDRQLSGNSHDRLGSNPGFPPASRADSCYRSATRPVVGLKWSAGRRETAPTAKVPSTYLRPFRILSRDANGLCVASPPNFDCVFVGPRSASIRFWCSLS